jgi:hypothetical protein
MATRRSRGRGGAVVDFAAFQQRDVTDATREVVLDLAERCPLCDTEAGVLQLVRRGHHRRVECSRRLFHVAPMVNVTWSPSPPADAARWEARIAAALIRYWGSFNVRLASSDGRTWEVVELEGHGPRVPGRLELPPALTADLACSESARAH